MRRAFLMLLAGALLVVALPAPLLAQAARGERNDRAQSLRAERREQLRAMRAEVPASLRSWIEGLPQAQRRVAVRRLRGMGEAERRRFFTRWEAMPDAEREAFQQRMQRNAEHHSERRAEGAVREAKRQRLGFAEKRKQWDRLSARDKRRMRDRLRSFRELPAERQQAIVTRNFPEASEAERAVILERLRGAGR